MPSRKYISNEENLTAHQIGEDFKVMSKQCEIYQPTVRKIMYKWKSGHLWIQLDVCRF